MHGDVQGNLLVLLAGIGKVEGKGSGRLLLSAGNCQNQLIEMLNFILLIEVVIF